MSIPSHIAIIPDGNRRWASDQGLSSVEGHQAGADRTREVALHAADRGVKSLSLWGMSLHNFTKRSPVEVKGLLNIFENEFLELADSDDIHSREVRINVIGHWKEKFPASVRKAIEQAIGQTESYSNHQLNFFLAYNGTDEMVQAIRSIVNEGIAVEDIDDAVIKSHLFTNALPSVDLLIRTGGEPHNSAGFMMWDVADSQLYFDETYWPAFDAICLDRAIEEFERRGRRHGK